MTTEEYAAKVNALNFRMKDTADVLNTLIKEYNDLERQNFTPPGAYDRAVQIVEEQSVLQAALIVGSERSLSVPYLAGVMTWVQKVMAQGIRIVPDEELQQRAREEGDERMLQLLDKTKRNDPEWRN